ncbi:hypothetical protein ACWEP8_36285 [Streptomyces hydrogenans]
MTTDEQTGVFYAMTKAMESGPHFLGVTPAEWTAAFVAAVLVAIAWELCMALTRRITKRLPFLMLRLARLGMSHEEWEQSYEGEWKPELHAFLMDPECGRLRRFLRAMCFATPLAFGGARMAIIAKRQSRRRLRDWARSVQRRTLRLVAACAMSIAMSAQLLASIFEISESIRFAIIASFESIAVLVLTRVYYLTLVERRRRRAAKKK